MGKQIELTQGKVAIVDDEDHEWLSQWKWCYHHTGYAVRFTGPAGKQKMIKMHRLIFGASGGMWVDHVNRDRLDNRRHNLRIATRRQSNINRVLPNPYGYRGVFFQPMTSDGYPLKKPWYARIRTNSKRIRLGSFFTAEEAARAYDKAAQQHHGEFAVLNFPEAAT